MMAKVDVSLIIRVWYWLNPLRLRVRHLFLNAWYLLMAEERILVLGDSHAEVFDYISLRRAFYRKKIIMGHVQGATASGLQNPSSKTQSQKQFLDRLNQEKYDRIFLMLGEVDTGYVIWYRAKKYDLQVGEMFKQAVAQYQHLISQVTEYAPLTVFSTPLPTISDDKEWGEVANLRKTITVSQRERTQLTLRFNSEIERYCIETGVPYISLDDESMGDDGVVRASLKNPNPLDHHYSNAEYSNMLIPHLIKVFNES